MALIAKETSNTSPAVYYILNNASASHSGSTLSVIIDIRLVNDGSSSLGSGEDRIRNCYLYDGSGSLFSGTYCLKDSSTPWDSSLDSTWTITYTKNIGYGAWSSNCYIRIGPNTSWGTTPSVNSFWWNGEKTTSTGTVGQTFSVSVGSAYVVPSISSHPASTTKNSGETASFSVTASGGYPTSYNYQWQLSTNGGTSYSNISGATSASYSVSTIVSMNGYRYRCVVSTAAGSVTSNAATLTVLGTKATATTGSTAVTVNEGADTTLTVAVTVGNPTLTTCQWQRMKNGEAVYSNLGSSSVITSNGNITLTLEDVAYSVLHNAKYRLAVTNTIGINYSPITTLTVNTYPAAPTIIFPVEGSKTYNNNPYTLYQWGIDVDGNAVLGNVEIDGTVYNSNNAVWDIKGSKTTAAISLIKLSGIVDGEKELSGFGYDGAVNSSTVSVQFTVETPIFTDTIAANVTPVKAVHFTELRTILNEIEAYYGLTETVWSELEVGGNVKAVHVIELRQAAERVRTYINSVASSAFQIPAFTWTDSTLKNKRIKAVHLNEIRSKISLL